MIFNERDSENLLQALAFMYTYLYSDSNSLDSELIQQHQQLVERISRGNLNFDRSDIAYMIETLYLFIKHSEVATTDHINLFNFFYKSLRENIPQ